MPTRGIEGMHFKKRREDWLEVSCVWYEDGKGVNKLFRNQDLRT